MIEKQKEYGPLGRAARSEDGPDYVLSPPLPCRECGAKVPYGTTERIGWLIIPTTEIGDGVTVCPQCQTPDERRRAMLRVKNFLRIHYGGKFLALSGLIRQHREMLDEIKRKVSEAGITPDDDPGGVIGYIEVLDGYLK